MCPQEAGVSETSSEEKNDNELDRKTDTYI